jgi:NAD(P)-dependent dehydrogenase (short-subunit alcohol dehydrogenase family)
MMRRAGVSHSYVVTGGARGVGRAITERLLADRGARVVVLDLDPTALDWITAHPAGERPDSIS